MNNDKYKIVCIVDKGFLENNPNIDVLSIKKVEEWKHII